jgi:hypothetical protein
MDNPTKLKNFRFDQTDIKNLEQITEAVNKVAGRPINQTRIVRALLQIGTEMDPEKIIECLRTELL